MKDFIDTLNEEQRQALLDALTSTEINTSVNPEPQETDTEDNITEDFRVVKSDTKFTKRREPVRARENLWTDTGEHKDIVTPETQKTPRNRKPPKKQDVTCHICGKKEKVNSGIVYGEFYRCNRCIG
jgi:hypothetical protein